MRRASFVLHLGTLGLLSCGGGGGPPPKTAAPLDALGPQPESAEWLFVTEGTRGGRRDECAVVATQIADEQSCKGSLCRHGAALAKDWLNVCQKLVSGGAEDVARQERAMSQRASSAALPCESQVAPILRHGCGDRDDCATFLQDWATQCSEWATPLVVRMLEVAATRKQGDAVKLDARGCGDMLAEVRAHAQCAQQFQCQDALPVLERYRERCLPAGKLPPLHAAITELAVRVGAGQTPPPMPVQPGGEPLEPTRTPLPLEDNSGAVLMICGARPSGGLEAYAAARQACQEDLLLARRFDTEGGSFVHLGRVPHLTAASYRRWFPALALAGEVGARYAASLPAYERALDSAIALSTQAGRSAPAVAAFLEATRANLDELIHSAAYDAALRAKDGQLVPLFRAVGEAKQRALRPELEPRRLVPALHRARTLVLADVTTEGNVSVGNSTAAASIPFDDMLPRSMAAYREAFEGRTALLARLKPSTRETERLASEVETTRARCGESIHAHESTSRTLLGCFFGVTQCQDTQVASLTVALEQSRRDAELAYPRAALAIASLPAAEQLQAWDRAKAAGCKPPWW